MTATYAADLAPVLAGFRPPPELTVSEWADAERILPDTSAEPGRYRTSRTPYMRGIQDAIHEPGVERIAVRKSHQVGGSQGLNNIVGYLMAYDATPMLLALPNIESAESYAKGDLADMISSTPALAAKVHEGRGPNAESTLRLKLFPGGFLALAGANSPAGFRRLAVRVFIGDDVDGWPPALEQEGDPVELGINRTTTFKHRGRKILLVSTPTLKGGRIDTWYERSDQRRFFVPCPHCGRMDWLTFSHSHHFRIVFEGRDPATAQLACPSPEDTDGCGGRIDEDAREALVAKGEWRPTAVSQEPGLVGFHVWAAYSPWESLADITAKFLASRERGRESIRVFVNTTLGEGFEDTTQRVEPMPLLNRREAYGPDVEVPAGAACLVAGVDTQDNRYELLVLAVGPGEEKWVVDWRQIMGDPREPNTAAALHAALFDRKYRHALGVDLPIHAICIDSAGHRTDDVYAFVAAHAARYCYATIGRAGLTGKPIVHKSDANDKRLVDLYTVNVDDAKARILSDLALEVQGPGYWHLPQGVDTIDEAFVNQLTAEQQVTHRNKKTGVVYQAWVQIRAENHALDCFCDQTEVLTRKGWRRFEALKGSELLATVNLGTDAIEYQEPTALLAKPYNGRMLHLHGRRLDILVTPGHRMVTYTKQFDRATGRWNFDVPPEITRAEDLTLHHMLKCAASWSGAAPLHIRLGVRGPGLCECGCGATTRLSTRTDQRLGRVKGQPIRCIQGHLPQHTERLDADAPDFAELLGWYVAEGSSAINAVKLEPGNIKSGHQRYVVSIAQKPGDKAHRIAKLLDRLPWRWRNYGRSFEISSKPLAEYLERECGHGAENKRVPQWVKDASPEIIARFVDAAILGDGWTVTKAGQRPHRTYATVSRELADDMQELFIKLGRTANIKTVPGKPWAIRGRSGNETRTQYHVSECKAPRQYLVRRGVKGQRSGFIGRWQPYVGMVYCATVPNGTLICRRNDRAFIAGNCAVLANAAFRIRRPNPSQMLALLRHMHGTGDVMPAASVPRQEVEAFFTPPPTPQPPARRVSRSAYLGG